MEPIEKMLPPSMEQLKHEQGGLFVVLIAEGKEFLVHREKLLDISCYCRRIVFSKPFCPINPDRIEFETITSDLLNEIVKNLYEQEPNINDDNALEMYKTSRLMEYSSLLNKTRTALYRLIRTSNCINIMKFAKSYRDYELFDCATGCIGINLSEIITHESFLSLRYDDLKYILNITEVVYKKEGYVFNGILNWIKQDITNNSKFFWNLIKFVKFNNLSIEFLRNIDMNESILQNDDFYMLIIDTYKFKNHVKTEIYGIDEQSIYYFESRQDEWCEKLKLPTKRERYGVVLLHNILYIIGGIINGKTTNTVLTYEPKKNEWISVCSMYDGRSDFETNILNGKIYVVGGTGENNVQETTVERYDPKSNEWDRITPMLDTDMYRSVVTDNLLFIIGNIREDKTRRLKIYDSIKNYWYEQTDLSECNYEENYVLSNDRIFYYQCGDHNYRSFKQKLFVEPIFNNITNAFNGVSPSIPHRVEDIENNQLVRLGEMVQHFRFVSKEDQLIILKMPDIANKTPLKYILTFKTH